MLFIGKPMGRSIMISNATNPLKESRKESLLRCAGSTSICVWSVCDFVVMCVQAVGDRALGDLCVCVRCGSVQSQKVSIYTIITFLIPERQVFRCSLGFARVPEFGWSRRQAQQETAHCWRTSGLRSY